VCLLCDDFVVCLRVCVRYLLLVFIDVSFWMGVGVVCVSVCEFVSHCDYMCGCVNIFCV